MQDNSDIFSDSSDEQSSFRPPNIHNNYQNPYDQPENNRTADTINLQMATKQDQKMYAQASKIFLKFFNQKILIPPSRSPSSCLLSQFQSNPLLHKYSPHFYPPCCSLYFLPTTILLYVPPNNNPKSDMSGLAIVNRLMEQFVKRWGNVGNFRTPNNSAVPTLLIDFHTKELYKSYRLQIHSSRYQQHPNGQQHPNFHLFDPELSLYPLFNFYMKNYNDQGFKEMYELVLYWCYRRGILGQEFTAGCVGILLVFFYCSLGIGVLNIVEKWNNQGKNKGGRREIFQKMRGMYRVHKKLDCEIQEELYGYENWVALEKRSFYVESQKKYSTRVEILTIPYPITEQDIQQQSQKIQKQKLQINSRSPSRTQPNSQSSSRSPAPISILLKFFKFLQYLQNYMKRPQRIIIDIGKDKKGITTRPENDFNIEIRHPIFGHNMCEKLTNNSSRLRIFKQEVSYAIGVYRGCAGNGLEMLMKIFQKC